VEGLKERRRVVFFLGLFAFLLFFEFPGSYLFEPDEARYAEIPREMLATGQWLVPRLNFVDYFEKPPLTYWANAASIAVLGENPFAARLPNRLAALGSALVLLFGLRRAFGARTARIAALACLSSPLFFGLGRTNLTDNLLTFFLTLAVVAIFRFLEDREADKPARGWAAAAGFACGLAVLTKGLVGIVLPGGALLLWCLLLRRGRRIGEILRSWAPVACVAVAAPYFVAVESAAPGFSKFFWIHEHFQRFATPEASRPGPLYYFAAIFLVGFLPWALFLGGLGSRFRGDSSAAPAWRADLWFALFAGFTLLFFSISRSKLPPYILPAFPAASVLAARILTGDSARVRLPLLAHALFWTVAAPVGIVLSAGEISRYGLMPEAVAAGAALAAFSWAGYRMARRTGAVAISPILTVLTGWAILYAALIFAFPRVATDQSAHALAVAAGNASKNGATVVAYRTYLQGFPWILGRRIPIYGWRGELRFGSERDDPARWFPPRERFLRDWDSGRKMVALLRARDRKDLYGHYAELVARNRKYIVVKNF
jgi:4-amino-4-deoxy-L-arabinose transferase-like glycosyltransferase